MKQITLDVSELEPPQPMTEILTALSELGPDRFLKVIHRREPFPLYPKLNAAGWEYYCHSLASDNFHIYIYRQTEQAEFERLMAL
jgi:uncharacterized protein (DUF2249 family)